MIPFNLTIAYSIDNEVTVLTETRQVRVMARTYSEAVGKLHREHGHKPDFEVVEDFRQTD